MGSFLHRLGNICFRHKWAVLAIWLALLAGLGTATALLAKPLSDAISIPGTPAQKAIDELGELFPQGGQGSGRIVFHADDGAISGYQQQINTGLQTVSELEGITAAISPFLNTAAISVDGRTAYAQVQLQDDQVTKDLSADISEAVESMRHDGLEVEVSSGLVGQELEVLGIGELLGVALALLVLVVTFGALIAAGLPIINALLAIGVSMAGLMAVTHFIDLNSTTPVLAVMLGLAVGIDYSLFIVSKYRNLLLAGYSYEQAAGKAIGTAGNAVVYAAATVVIALSALSVVRIPFMTTMGVSAAVGIAIAAAVALTVTPALLAIFGTYVFGRKTVRKITKAQALGVKAAREVEISRFWSRWIEGLVRRPLVVVLPIVIGMVIVSLPVLKIDLGLPGDQTAASDTTQRKAYDLLANAFGVGYNAPLTVLVKDLPVTSEADKALLQQQLTSSQGSEAVATMPEATEQMQAQLTQYIAMAELKKVADRMATQSNVQTAAAAMVSEDETAGLIQVIPKTAPNDVATTDLIHYIRDNPAQATGSADVSVQVTGATALEADVNNKLLLALPQYLLVVVGLSLVLLMVAFRSILIPIKATVGFLLSVMVMFGAMVAIFQWGWFGIAEGAPLVSFVPIISIGILFGLAMDYEFFLVSGMHEAYAHTKDPKKAVISGFKQGAKVVTAAATIMVFVFAGFISNHSDIIRSIGFGLALGIFVDAFIVRMTLVPAVMSLLGKSAWWLPRGLSKIIPNVSIEGDEGVSRQSVKRK